MKPVLLKKILLWIAAIVIILLATAGTHYAIVELTKERSTSVFQFRWNGHGWKVDHVDNLPRRINSPFGFLHQNVTYGKSYTLVVPHTWTGDGEARVYFWKEDVGIDTK